MRLAIVCAALVATAMPTASWSAPPPGADSFDFQFGDWRVHHRAKRPSGEWYEFEGDCTDRPILGGLGNVEDNIFYKAEGVTRGVALRTFDPKTSEWAIWWVDGRNPHGALDPPLKGKFVGGVGTFYADGDLGGRPVQTRFIWSRITPKTARWEQAYSFDAGKTWNTNWIMEFERRTA